MYDLWMPPDIRNMLGSRFHLYLRKHASWEVNPYNSLPRHLQEIYIQLIRVAALRVPLDLERQVDPKKWGIPNATSTAPLAELIQLLNAYIERNSYYNRDVVASLAGPLHKEKDPDDGDYNSEDDDVSMWDAEYKNPVTWLISFPPVVLDEIASTVQHQQLPFWRCYYEVCSLLLTI